MPVEAKTASDPPTQQMDPPSHARVLHPDPSSTNTGNASTATNTAGSPSSNSNPHVPNATTARRSKHPTTWAHISAAVLKSLRDLHCVISLAGVIQHVSANSTGLLGYRPEQLVGTILVDHVHEDDIPVFRDELREASSTGHSFRFYCRIRNGSATAASGTAAQATLVDQDEDSQPPFRSTSYSIFEIHGRFHQNPPPDPVPVGIGLVATPPSDDGIFVLMARPYPLMQSTKLDSFLSLKIENERLMARLAALKAEDEEDKQDSDYAEHQLNSVAAPSFSTIAFSRASDGFPWFDVTPSTTGLTTGSRSSAQDSIFSSSGSSSLFGPASANSTNSTMSNLSSFPSSSTVKPDTPLLVGRTLSPMASGTGKSPTNAPTVMEGDVGIPFIVKALTGATGIKKRTKHVEDYVCAWCSTTNSPEWRKGPGGPKSLCNACGLRYAKARRKSGAPDSTASGSGGSNSGRGPATGPDADGSGNSGAGAASAGSASTAGPVVA
ncbi:hypothetical protein B0J12DRAFT_17499 [Macrophomina phaseolina]|uniref:PAS domain-containing protein n=1 Tax=Macrophomina phaseolina TaxID=35725 RepID=A0ABQ8GUH3_9PEZI|nr:hypothetical protein B0J12DRAFT_17499 [Macrophomina phaseolina]